MRSTAHRHPGRVRDRKRQLAAGSQGLALNVFAEAVNVPDTKAVPAGLVPVLEACDRGQKILADQDYRGKLAKSIDLAYGCTLEIIKELGDCVIVSPTKSYPSIMRFLFMLP